MAGLLKLPLVYPVPEPNRILIHCPSILYKSLGVGPKTILALASLYGTCAFVSNVLTTRFMLDQWGRRKMIIAGLTSVVVIEIYAAVMQRVYQNTTNQVGKGFAILGIYLFVVFYYGFLNSTTWLYGAEVLPVALRSKVMGLAAASHFIVNVGITEAGPSAFATIHENYYYVVSFWQSEVFPALTTCLVCRLQRLLPGYGILVLPRDPQEDA